MLHLNELPLRHVFQNLDGVTSGPDSFSGPIGRQLNGAVPEWKVVKFKSIPNPKFLAISNSLMDDLSSDQYSEAGTVLLKSTAIPVLGTLLK